MRISDWSSDVCSSDLPNVKLQALQDYAPLQTRHGPPCRRPKPVGGGYLDRRPRLSRTDFKKGPPFRRKQRGQLRNEATVVVQSVHPRKQRAGRFIIRDIARKPGRAFYIGRVAKNAMEAARQGLRPIAANKGGADTQPQTTRISRGNRQSGGRPVHPHTRAFRPLVQRSEQQRTAARAEIEEAQTPNPHN